MSIHRWRKIPPHCFRRGATQEIQLAEASTGAIKKAGCWYGIGFRPYLDANGGRAKNIATVNETDRFGHRR